ncbi:hypothetical protein [Megasphaera massiliensis]|uniref:hypothetical protein n=1 Tax=Megasphaera massiliensis TaxID=1232428 RepID=UPI003AB89917
MSKWTDVRDSVLEVLDVDNVTEEVKQQLTTNLINNGLPAIEAVANKFTAQIQAQAKDERGWTKVRDQVVLPLIISGCLWAAKLALNKSVQQPKQ